MADWSKKEPRFCYMLLDRLRQDCEYYLRIGGTVSYILGIVEFEDGQIKQVFPEKIKFVDKMFDEYYWKGKSKNS